jgi:hypothetical protein
VDLRGAHTHRLVDDGDHPERCWTSPGRLLLDGFTYTSFAGEARGTWTSRLEWLRLQYPFGTREATAQYFVTRPYEQLAAVYRAHGQDSDARRIAIAQRNDLRRYGPISRSARIRSWLLNATIRHGYQPLRAVALLLAVYLGTFGAFWAAQHHPPSRPSYALDLVVPAKDVKTLQPSPTARRCTATYPCFYPALLALDTVVPIINIHQAENWRLNGDAPFGWALVTISTAATLLGWGFSTLAVVGYTGLVRRD